MSSPYQILDNRPLDHWKVTELKEELRRRKLTTKGLKEDLVKLLDEAVRIERANAQKDVDNGLNGDPRDVAPVKTVDTNSIPIEGNVDDGREKTGKVDVAPVQVDINDSAAALVQGNIQEGYVLVDKNSAAVEEKLVVHSTTVETSMSVAEFVVPSVTETEQDLQKIETQEENGDPKPQLANEDLKTQLANEDSKPQVENEDSKPQVANEDSKPQLESDTSKPLLESDDSKPQLESENSKPQLENVCSNSTSGDVMLNLSAPNNQVSAPNNQVSEVSPILGSQVKYDSISTDSVSINEKIELKDNIIADHVKLELDVIKPEMVEPSSSTVVPVGGDSHPMDVEEPHESKASVGEKDDDSDNNADLSKKNDSVDVGYSEKLNLDRSSGDDSMEEDVLEIKQIDSRYNSDDVGDRIEKIDVSAAKEEESHVDVVGDDFPADKKDDHVENKDRPTAIAEKRKFNDQALGGNSEPQKRQRRWNSESLKVPEPQSSNITPITPKDNFQSGAPKRNFSRSDSTVSEDATKERVVPPSPKTPTNSLRIDRFLRPFTLKAVQELLGKTGKVTNFWMDHIKTHCYVTYSSVEEAIKTRNAVYNLQWPPNGGRLLVAEFVDAQEVKTRVETPQTLQTPQTPQTPVASANLGPPVSSIPPNLQQPSPRLHKQQQQLPPPHSLPPPPPPQLSNPAPAREQLPLPPAPPLAEKLDPPIVTLDDLFRKTKAIPRIYYLPLAEEQVEAKLAMQGKNKRQ
ncbi:uncharacterized protein LOC107425402 [Ziziphus jujuba]|uniref:Uncharacterized protein LOC107425402 n=1 Tax=Ziziphus jujuba TaxID=326968 RepID=A0A6P4AXV6_ZIZJJ|nr:uncharacterized protein LOC107425402 [Ziziphus jujuba]